MSYKFEASKRIHKTKEYQYIFEKGKRQYGAGVRIHYLIEGECIKIGVIISKKIRGSVVRNRCKRIVREFFRVNQNQFKGGLKMVVVVTTLLKTIKNSGLEEELNRLFTKAGILVVR